MDVSVVIPAYNESQYIGNTVRSIVSRMPSKFEFEVVVVDHGSTDGTAALAVAAGARVLDGSGARTIAQLRNLGVANTTGRVLIFLDADITLGESWARNFGRVIEALASDGRQIFGSNPGVPDSTTPLVKAWFEPKVREVSPTHIGSCHLIITRAFFVELGGFPENQETSEEFLLCHYARKANGKIVGMPELDIIHHGAPKTMREFMRSEFWHGRGDWNSISTVLSSRVAIGSLIFMALHLWWAVAILLWGIGGVAPLLPLLAILAMCIASAVMKFASHGAMYVVKNTVTFYFYFIARSASLFSAIWTREIRKRTRNG